MQPPYWYSPAMDKSMTQPQPTQRDVDPCPALPHNENEVLDALEEVLSIFNRRGHAEVKVFVNPNQPSASRVYPVSAADNDKVKRAREVIKRWGR